MTSRWSLLSRLERAALVAAALLLTPVPALASDAQTPVDRSDPSVVTEEIGEPERERSRPRETPAVAAADADDVMTPVQPFVAGAIRVDGATALPPSTFAPVIEPYLGRELGAGELRALARAVADAARRAGYGLATAWVPPQSVANGVLRVRVDEGRIDAVEAGGPAGPAVERLLRRLTGGAPVRTAALERQLLLAADLAGVTVRGARLVRSGGRNVLRVDTGFERLAGRALIDNWGTSAIGPVRARLAVDVNGLLAVGDSLSLAAVATPLQPREFQMIQAGYSLPVGLDGTEVGLRGYVSRSAAGGSLRDRDLDGTSAEIEAGLSHPLLRGRAQSLWGQVTLGLRDSELTRADVRLREDRIVTATGSLHGWARLAGGTSRVRLSLVQGLDALGATRRGDPLASRDDAGGVFTKLAFWADHVQPLGGGFSVQLSGEGQLASRPLLASEEIGLGGRSFLRGYDYREFAGDRGAAGAVELRFDLRDLPRPARRAQLYAYADAGRVANLRGGTGGGSLASAGGGVRVWLDHGVEAGLELGVPLRDGAAGAKPEPRFSFVLATRF